ncbi:MAG: hypothetical protein WC956_01035 [bacterium]
MREKRAEEVEPGHDKDQSQSPLDLIRMMGGKARRVGEGVKGAPDSMLAVYKDRLTYTFIMDDEVASIHFDRAKNEIFFRGHNIAHMELTEKQREALMALEEVLKADEQGKEFLSAYSATLGRCLADK